MKYEKKPKNKKTGLPQGNFKVGFGWLIFPEIHKTNPKFSLVVICFPIMKLPHVEHIFFDDIFISHSKTQTWVDIQTRIPLTRSLTWNLMKFIEYSLGWPLVLLGLWKRMAFFSF